MTQAPRRLGRTGLGVSSVGFGSNRTTADDPTSLAALARCLAAGINLVDTATMYMARQSEAAIGAALAGRRDVVVVSKCGYGDAGAWSMAPDFVAAELAASLARLGRIDVYLLHNPEVLLERGTAPDQVYAQLARAFAVLEAAAAAGQIGWYGVSSNGFSEPLASPLFVSLPRVWQAAQGGSHFGVIELPFNLIETGAALVRDGEGKTTLDWARELDLGVLLHRALSAHLDETPVRLDSDHPAAQARLAALDRLLPEPVRSASAAHKAMLVARDLPGPASLLVGLRQPAHVDAALAVLAAPPLAVTPAMLG